MNIKYSFIAITTQSEKIQDFMKSKSSLKNFEETENSRKSNDNKNSVMKANSKFENRHNSESKPLICYTCGVPGHKSSVCEKKKNRWCSICKNNSHLTSNCRKRYKPKDKVNKTTAEHGYAFKVGDGLQLQSSNTSFLVDCGATTHIVNHDNDFIDIDDKFDPSNHFIELADGTRCNNVAKKRGTILTKFCTNDGQHIDIKLCNVLFIPSYPQNIFSVQAAAEKGCSFRFHENGAELVTYDGTKFPIYKENKLYFLYKTVVEKKRVETLQTWHKILGHCNVKDICKMEKVVKGMKISNHDEFQCETCTLAKQTNTRNRNPDVRAKEPFELIHTDLSGPIDPISKNGHKYAIVFTDDYSGCIFTYFIKEKSDATRATEKFLADISPYGKIKSLCFHEDLFPTGNIQRLRSDNGGEFTSHEFQSLMLKNQIKHEKSAPYSPHQNGTAERSWRTLFDMARSLILDSGLPKYLWTYAVMNATHIRNRCYSQRIQNTPYGLITGTKPDISDLHLFGSICYSYVNNAKKLDPRSEKGIFIGYDRDSPSYLVYNPISKSVSKNRLVKFTDTIKPFNDDDPYLTVGQDEEQEISVGDEEVHVQHNDNVENEEVPMENNNEEEQQTVKKYPTRTRQTPDYFGSYVKECVETNSVLDFCYYTVPQTFNEAVSCQDSISWKIAMDTEMEMLKLNNTFTLTELPPNKSIVGGRWVYTLKGDPENPMYKARYVAKGYSQVEGIDYHETFSPTARMETVRSLVQLSCQNDLLLHQMDVKSAYLHAPIEEEIYIRIPPGYESENPKQVWKLSKSLYGLKQSGRNWNMTLHEHLKDHEFIQSKSDPCLFIRKVGESDIVYLLVWVDDIIIASSDSSLMDETKTHLSKAFDMKDLGELKHFVGIEFVRINDSISLSQEKYIVKLLQRFKMEDIKPRGTPCELNLKSYDSCESKDPVDQHLYRQLVGSLIYAMVCTRPDISYVVTKLSQHLSSPSQADFAMVKHVFRYLKKTINYKLTYRKSTDGLQLTVYSDADWAASNDRRSISGFCISLNPEGPPISWKSKRQCSVALSTCEAEYVAMSIACQELVYLKKNLLQDMLCMDLHAVLYSDNQGAIALSKNPTKHSKAKHIDIRFHFIRECYLQHLMKLEFIPSNDNYADIFTKPPKKLLLQRFHSYIFGH